MRLHVNLRCPKFSTCVTTHLIVKASSQRRTDVGFDIKLFHGLYTYKTVVILVHAENKWAKIEAVVIAFFFLANMVFITGIPSVKL